MLRDGRGVRVADDRGDRADVNAGGEERGRGGVAHVVEPGR